jgi:hypothetical protein
MKELIDKAKKLTDVLYLTQDVEVAVELKTVIDQIVTGAFNEGTKTGKH